MSFQDGIFGEHTMRWFNGGLFEDNAVIQLDKADMGILYEVSKNYDWAHIAPAIFGTLLERSLDPARRSLIGAHHTSEEDILLLIEPVVMQPLQQRWATVKENILATLSFRSAAKESAVAGATLSAPTARHITAQGEALGVRQPRSPRAESPAHKSPSLLTSNRQAEDLLAAWFDQLAAIRILDPACGSGNFLYLVLRRLLDLWKQARDFAVQHNIQLAMKYAVEKMVSPSQLLGIETEFYAHELASIVVWIGFLQWKHEHAILEDREPILQKLNNIQHDALHHSKETEAIAFSLSFNAPATLE